MNEAMEYDLTTVVRDYFAEKFGSPQILDQTIKSMTENTEMYFATAIKDGVGTDIESFGDKLGSLVENIEFEQANREFAIEL